MFLTCKYRLFPSKRQYRALADISEAERQLYNGALEERIDCYKKTGTTISYADQSASLTRIRASDPGVYGSVPVSLSRGSLQRINRAFQGFFQRVKSGCNPGFPRFKSKDGWRGFGFSEIDGVHFDGRRIRFKGMPSGLRVHMHRPLPEGRLASCQFIQDVNGWSVCFQVEVKSGDKKIISRAIGIDLGLIAFAYQSDGVAIPAPKFARRMEREMRRRSRALARCKRGSNRRKKARARLARLQLKIYDTRRTWLHQQSARIANSYDLIAVEDLNVAGLLKNEHLARSISDAGWATFTNMLSYKAEKAGGTFVEVDPKMTSQNCSGCGEIVRKGLADRVHSCPECGLVLDRDHNAALNILKRAVLRPCEANVGRQTKRSRGKIRVVA